MLDVADTVFSYLSRALIVCQFLQESSKVKWRTLYVILNAHTTCFTIFILVRNLDFTIYNFSPLLSYDTPVDEQFRGYVLYPDADAVMSTGRLEHTGTGLLGHTTVEPDTSDTIILKEGKLSVFTERWLIEKADEKISIIIRSDI